MKIESIAVSKKKGTRKTQVYETELVADHGLEGDAHAGQWHRQVSFLSSESIQHAREKGLDVTFGDFAENIATSGIDWQNVPIGTHFKVGDKAIVEITQIGKECHNRCAIYYMAGDCIMPREGVFGRVLEGGKIRCNDSIRIINQSYVSEKESEEKGQDNSNKAVMAGNTESFEVIRYSEGKSVKGPNDLIVEEPLVIRIDGQPYATIMRTPGEETFHAAGFCLSEGIVDDFNDFASIGFCKDMDANVVEITLTPETHKRAENILKKKNLISLSSCGICGRELIEERIGYLASISNNVRIKIDDAVSQIEGLQDIQQLHNKTLSSHAALILDSKLEPLSISEDVGRHNALDKAIGRLFMNGKLVNAAICVLSSRISYEMVIKANRARIPVILGASRPTALAVKLGRDLNMTLACTAKDSGLITFSGEDRVY